MEDKFLNIKYPLMLEVITPIHIGAGFEKDWVEGADYLQKGNKLHKLNLTKIASVLDAETLAGFLINKNSNGLMSKLPGSLDEYSERVFSMPYRSINNIKAFIKNGLNNNPVIPGSSLKGAIRSILFKHIRGNNIAITKDHDVFGRANIGDEFMRFFKISDVGILDQTELINTKIFNLFGRGSSLKGGWKHGGNYSTNQHFKHEGFNTIYEVLMPNSKGFLYFMMSPDGFKAISEHKLFSVKKDLVEGGISAVFKIINGHTRNHLRKELDFFKKYQTEETHIIIESISTILNRIPDDNSSCVLKMSAGSGFHSITGDWQYDDYDNTGLWEAGRDQGKKKAKSRKLAVSDNYYQLMGFVLLKVISEKDIIEEEKRREKIILKIISEQKEKENKLEEVLRLKEEEENKKRNERIKIEQELEQKEKADIEKSKLFRLKTEKEKKEQEARQLLNKQKKERIKQERLKEGLSERLTEVSSYKKLEQIVNDFKKDVETIPESEYDLIGNHIMLLVDFSSMPKKQLKTWSNFKKGKWLTIRKWVSDQKAKELFEIINRRFT